MWMWLRKVLRVLEAGILLPLEGPTHRKGSTEGTALRPHWLIFQNHLIGFLTLVWVGLLNWSRCKPYLPRPAVFPIRSPAVL